MISIFVNDLIINSSNLIDAAGPKTSDDIRSAGQALISHSESIKKTLSEIREFLFTNMYRHYRVNRMTSKARKLLKDLFKEFFESPFLLPSYWQNKIYYKSNSKKVEYHNARVIADYIASLTDREAILEHDRLFNLSTNKEKI